MRFKAVFFDAGETLLGPHPSFHALFGDVLREHGEQLSEGAIQSAFEKIAPTMTEVLDNLGTETWSTSSEVSRAFWGKVYRSAFDHMGIDDGQGILVSALYDRFTQYSSYRLFPDALPVLEQVRAAGLKLGLISNFEAWLEGMLVDMRIAHLFDDLVISGKEGIEKPDPRIFQMALDRSGVTGSESVYVGDHPRIDAEGARKVGMTDVLIDRRDRHRDFDGHRITSLNELLPVLESL